LKNTLLHQLDKAKQETDKALLILTFSIDISQLTENQSAIIKAKHTSLGIIGYSNLVKRYNIRSSVVPTDEYIFVKKNLTESKLFPKQQLKIDKLCFVLMPYEDSISGGVKLKNDLIKTIKLLLNEQNN
jgi:hypothetical protein